MKRPAAAKRKVEELEDFGPETEVVAGSGGMVQIPEEGIDDKAKSEKKAKKGKTAEEQEGEADDDKAKNGKKSKKGRTAEEKEVLDSLPDLELQSSSACNRNAHYIRDGSMLLLLQPRIEVMPYWSRPHLECGVVRKATPTRPKKQAGCSCSSVCDVCTVAALCSSVAGAVHLRQAHGAAYHVEGDC